LVAIDGSESSDLAVDEAIKLAKQFGSEIVGITVFDIGSYAAVSQAYGMGDERALMNNVANTALEYFNTKTKEAGIKADTVFVSGRPADKIVAEAKKFDLLVCGTIGRTGISHAILGSVAEKIIRLAPCNVLVCRKK
jgi:nucleotide-binding universal stress UspA family protein